MDDGSPKCFSRQMAKTQGYTWLMPPTPVAGETLPSHLIPSCDESLVPFKDGDG